MHTDKCECLLVWLNTFERVGDVVLEPPDLTDGLTIARILQEIAPAWFDLADLKDNISDNWRLKVSNLRKVKNAILEYYQEVLELELRNFPLPDCSAIGEKDDPENLGILLQLVLGCAVHCDEKEEHIRKIMGLEEHIQTGVMQCIQELMDCEIPRTMGNRDFEEKLKESHHELNSVFKENEEHKQRLHDLELQLEILRSENESLHAENDQLKLRSKTDQDSMDKMMSSQDSNNVSQLVEDFRAERFQLEAARDDYKLKMEHLEAENNDLTERLVELQEQASQSKRLKDEVDELNYKLISTVKLEQQLESYKKKIEEIPDLRSQIKNLESQIDNHLQEKVSLEDENKRQTLYKNQLEKYKVDIRRLQEEVLSETKRADKLAVESDKYKSKCDGIEKINLELVQERASLKERLEDLQFIKNNSLGGGTNSFIDQSDSKETIQRLRVEVENLRLQVEDKGISDTDVELLREELKESKDYQAKIQDELRSANRRIAVLESDVKISTDPSSTTQEIINLQDNLSIEKSKHRETMEMLDKKNNRIKELEPRVKSAAEAINSLKDIIKKKDDEIKAQEEKYKRFLGKAKQVIKAIDPKGSQSPNTDTALLRKQLAEKEKALARMEDEAERLKATREREERMVLSAWYEMGMHVHKKGLEERLSPQVSSPRSVLSQRRSEMRRSTISGKAGARS